MGSRRRGPGVALQTDKRGEQRLAATVGRSPMACTPAMQLVHLRLRHHTLVAWLAASCIRRAGPRLPPPPPPPIPSHTPNTSAPPPATHRIRMYAYTCPRTHLRIAQEGVVLRKDILPPEVRGCRGTARPERARLHGAVAVNALPLGKRPVVALCAGGRHQPALDDGPQWPAPGPWACALRLAAAAAEEEEHPRIVGSVVCGHTTCGSWNQHAGKQQASKQAA